jgi:CBS domain-containing protein
LERAVSPGADVAITESQTSAAAEPEKAAVSAAAPSEAEEQKDEEVEEVVPESVPKRSARSPSHHPPPPPRVRAQAAAHGSRPLNIGGTPKVARDLMTRQLLTIGPSDPIESLEQHMEAFRFRHLPVVDGNKLVGLISHSDLLHASSSFLSTSARQENVIIHRLPASRIMQRELITVRPNEPLADVANLMWETRVGCVLVTDENDVLVGIITEGDFMRLAHHFLTREGQAPR